MPVKLQNISITGNASGSGTLSLRTPSHTTMTLSGTTLSFPVLSVVRYFTGLFDGVNACGIRRYLAGDSSEEFFMNIRPPSGGTQSTFALQALGVATGISFSLPFFRAVSPGTANGNFQLQMERNSTGTRPYLEFRPGASTVGRWTNETFSNGSWLMGGLTARVSGYNDTPIQVLSSSISVAAGRCVIMDVNSTTSGFVNNILMGFTSTGLRGAVQTSTTASQLVFTSDYRLKFDIQDLTQGLDLVNRLKPCRFRWKSNPIDIPMSWGFLAHEVQEVYPDAVHGQKDAVDQDGNMRQQYMSALPLIPMMASAIQQLADAVDLADARLKQLEDDINEI